MADSPIATAADYADAMLTARSAKNALFLILLVLMLLQLAIFFMYRYDVVQFTPNLIRHRAATTTTTTAASVRPVLIQRSVGELLLTYLVGLIDFLGVALVIVLALVLLLMTNIMLVGRLIGVARVTSAYIWTLILLVLVFPWQAFLGNYAFKIPGVLYTWDELTINARWSDLSVPDTILHWARFLVMPVVALLILMAIQIKSVRGIRQALGEGADIAA